MVVYLDLVFIINSLSDALTLYITARLSGLPLRRNQFLIGVLLGGVYGTLCLLPQFSFANVFAAQLILAFFLIRIVFGRQASTLRVLFLFFFLSCTLGGAITAISQNISISGINNTLQSLNWKVFFLVGGICYFLLSVVFHGSARHAVAGQICRVTISCREKTVSLDVLLDTGHTLCDPFTGAPVLTVWCHALNPLWTKEEADVFAQLEAMGSLWCAEKITTSLPGKFRLIPYRAVGISHAMLMAFQADEVTLNGEKLGALTVALSPTPVSDGGGYSALWGGERKGKIQDAA